MWMDGMAIYGVRDTMGGCRSQPEDEYAHTHDTNAISEYPVRRAGSAYSFIYLIRK